MRFTPATIAALKEIKLEPVAAALPPACPPGCFAMCWWSTATWPHATAGSTGCGFTAHQAASCRSATRMPSRCSADCATGRRRQPASAVTSLRRALAQQTPLVTIAAPDSRAALELALRLQSLGLRNTCSEELGGYAPTSLEPIVWPPSASQHSSHYEGLAGGISFTADYTVKDGWEIIIHAC